MGWVYLFFVHKWRVLGSTSVLLSRPKTKHKDTGRRWKEHRSTPFQKSLKSSAIWKWTVPNMETQAIPRPFRLAATDRICMDLAPDLRWRFCRASRSSTTSWSSAIQQFYSRLTSWNVHQRQCLHTSGLLIKTFQVLYVCMYIYIISPLSTECESYNWKTTPIYQLHMLPKNVSTGECACILGDTYFLANPTQHNSSH